MYQESEQLVFFFLQRNLFSGILPLFENLLNNESPLSPGTLLALTLASWQTTPKPPLSPLPGGHESTICEWVCKRNSCHICSRLLLICACSLGYSLVPKETQTIVQKARQSSSRQEICSNLKHKTHYWSQAGRDTIPVGDFLFSTRFIFFPYQSHFIRRTLYMLIQAINCM